ncbi:hypothetical protein PQQ64_29095 [Paraburkholderia graminis]|uniref:hypothetical protein n=1 Tax=Paraburkholderia graminis TaxID=60548 RepID=UPI0038BC694A
MPELSIDATTVIERETVNAEARRLCEKDWIAADTGNFGSNAARRNGACALGTSALMLRLLILPRGGASGSDCGVLLRQRVERDRDRWRGDLCSELHWFGG